MSKVTYADSPFIIVLIHTTKQNNFHEGLLLAAQPHLPTAVEPSLSESEINKYLRTINLQVEVLKLAGQNKVAADKLLELSLFASQKQKAGSYYL